ncbi:MAG: phospho-N-acetylmuramoyl-pentapeptide-transferase [Clostridiales bacterium]|nr:phospho-N-acetylmuramoyl-pentapeptide-transferase [Clostridiales bacterium]
MLRMILALILSAAIVLLTGPKLIAWLRKLKLGQTMYELGPQSHMKKQGTPIMGGLCIALGCVVAFVVCGVTLGAWDHMLALLFVALGSMAVGFGDDWIKMVKKRHEGLTPWQKIIGQAVVCIGFACYCYFHPEVGSKIIIPFFNVEWDLGIFYIPLLALTVLFMVNSANLQDGLDGILSSVTAVGSIGWAAIALFAALINMANSLGVGMVDYPADEALLALAGNYQTIAVFALALCGACIGFLRFNHYPATVFMGDTGSMFIGGAVVGMAMLLRQPFLLLLIGFTMVMSSVSVILQRYYYKLTRKLTGTPKRLFKMSPIHHHFEMCGMKETQIVLMYAIVTAVLSAIAVVSVII